MQGVHLRSATAADQAFLWRMLYESFYVPGGHPPLPRSILRDPDVAKYVERWGQDGDLGIVAAHNAVDIGAAWLRLLKGKARGYGYVDDETPELGVALLPAYRGRGIGTALLVRLLGEAASRCKAVSLSVYKENPARKLYERLGFEKVGEDDTTVVMVKRL